jgi:hypothetical protein
LYKEKIRPVKGEGKKKEKKKEKKRKKGKKEKRKKKKEKRRKNYGTMGGRAQKKPACRKKWV